MGPGFTVLARDAHRFHWSCTWRTGVCKTGCLEEDVVESAFALHELLDRGDARILDAAAQTPVCELQELFGLLPWVIGRGDVDRLRWLGQYS